MGRTGSAITVNGKGQAFVRKPSPVKLGGTDYTITAWIKAVSGGTIVSFTGAGNWVAGGKTLFIRKGRLAFDIGWVGVVTSSRIVADGRWHHVALSHRRADGMAQLYVDGMADGRKSLKSAPDPSKSQFRFGFTSKNFPENESNRLKGTIDDVCLYDRVLSPDEIQGMCPRISQPQTSAVGLVTGHPDLTWQITDDGRIRLHVPSQATPLKTKLFIWRGRPKQLAAFAKAVSDSRDSNGPADLDPQTHGGPPRWPERLTTTGALGEDNGPYVIDTITAPMENPWESWLRFGGFDFFADGRRAALGTWNGDVWMVSGIDGDLDELTWQRIATGLFQPLGLKIIDEQIYVCCRDQITRLNDLNGDGETDFYENFNNDHQVTEHFHEFASGLETDADGNLYFAKAARHALDAVVPHHGTLIRVSPDGTQSEILCNGFRAPNGVAIGPNGEWVVSDQEGHWTPANRINLLKRDGFYGNMWSYHRGERPTTYEPPICWLPVAVDRSPAEQLWVDSDRWGPLKGSLLSTSYGTGQIFLVPYELVDGVPQGSAVRFPLSFPTGIMRARFHSGDGQLYVCGLYGWSSDKTVPGGFYRVRYTGEPVHMPVESHVMANGLSLKFTHPLARESAEDTDNYNLTQWNYRRAATYGSEHYLVSDPKRTGADPVTVLSATLSEDGRTVFLQLPNVQPVMQLRISYRLTAADGTQLKHDVYSTINVVPASRGIPAPSTRPKTPPTVAQQRNLQQGLILRFRQPATTGKAMSAATDARLTRVAALHVPAGSSATPLLDIERVRATFQGYLLVDLPGDCVFSLRGTGHAVLKLNDATVLTCDGIFSQTKPASVRLPKGHNTLQLDYTSPPADDATVRLYWESESFPTEPIPATLLYHDADDTQLVTANQLRTGRELFATHGCVKCHALPSPLTVNDGAMPELPHNAPSLADAATRLNGDWMLRWLQNPRAMRNKGRMPQVLHGDKPDRPQQAADLVAYLAGSPAKNGADQNETNNQQPHEDALIDTGEILFEDLGCIGCHRTSMPEEEDEFLRASLAYVGAKFRPGTLQSFLQRPHRSYAWSRMPDFRLQPEEASALVAYLLDTTTELPPVEEPTPAGDSERGTDLFQTLGCANCHATDGSGETKEPALPSVVTAPAERGCLANTTTRKQGVPDFDFTDDERAAALAFLRTEGQSLGRTVPLEAASRWIKTYNCAACHQRDGRNADWPIVLAEEGSRGLLAEAVPDLTWIGEKLKPQWIASFLKGELVQKARPWLKVRMPNFPLQADFVALGLSAEHGYPELESARHDAPQPLHQPDMVRMGGQLTLNEVGFNCVQCHDMGKQPATAPFDNRGVDFLLVPDRMRYDFYPRWMLDAPRIDIGTKMPKLAPDRRKTELVKIYDGDARKQFDAIWHYILSLQPLQPAPPQAASE